MTEAHPDGCSPKNFCKTIQNFLENICDKVLFNKVIQNIV